MFGHTRICPAPKYASLSKIGMITFICAFICLSMGFARIRAQDATPNPDETPPAVEMLVEPGNITNFLLLGSDTTNSNNSGRTDVMVVVSVNHDAGTVAMLSIPRDLYVYIPGERVYRINSAYGYGEQREEGQGYDLLVETLRYNLGLHIDYYARVDFNSFRQIVEDVGGIEISVDCGIQDWRLISPDLDPGVEENWEMFTLPIGIHEMDGELALWYARSRRTSSDFDRGRRHQALLRAIWRRIRALDLLTQVRDVYPQLLEVVDSNIPLNTITELATLATTLDTEHIASYTFRPNIEVRSWRSPEGSSVQALNREATAQLLTQFLQPPTTQQIAQEHARIEIINASGYADLAHVAADRLAWEGFVPVIGENAAQVGSYTRLYDYSGQTKGSSLERLAQVLRVQPTEVEIDPQVSSETDFRVVLGSDYYACTYNVAPPTANAEDS